MMAKRVAIVLYFYQCNGGAHRYLHSVCEEWHRRGYEFEVWYYRSESDEPAPPYAHKLPAVYPVRFFYINRVLQIAASTTAEIARRKRNSEQVPDVLVVLDAGEALFLGMVASLFGLRLVHNDRGMNDYFRSALNTFDYHFNRIAQRLSRTFVHTWVVNSQAKVAELTQVGIPATRIRIVPNGLRLYVPADLPAFTGGDREEHGALSLGYFSRPSYDRGVDTVFEIMRLLAGVEHTEGLLFFMTVEEQRLPVALRELEWIIPLGILPHEEVASWMASTDIILVPTRSESFGNTVLEGLYYGATVIASATGSLMDWQHVEGLFLVDDYENPEAWIEALAAVVPHTRPSQRRRFREELAAQYDFRQQADALYREFTKGEEL